MNSEDQYDDQSVKEVRDTRETHSQDEEYSKAYAYAEFDLIHPLFPT